jgi:hypothetical protein
LLSGSDAQRAGRLIAQRALILQGVIVPLCHRLMGLKTVHFEVRPGGP